MTPQPTGTNWQRKITIAAVAGLISGAARAIAAKILDHLTSN